jgi:hypothetical protein
MSDEKHKNPGQARILGVRAGIRTSAIPKSCRFKQLAQPYPVRDPHRISRPWHQLSCEAHCENRSIINPFRKPDFKLWFPAPQSDSNLNLRLCTMCVCEVKGQLHSFILLHGKLTWARRRLPRRETNPGCPAKQIRLNDIFRFSKHILRP